MVTQWFGTFCQLPSIHFYCILVWISCTAPPYIMPLPDLKTYALKGARVISPACYKGKCFQWIWAAMTAVVIEYDWGVRQKYWFESFCYGPKSCKFYKMGRPRAVPIKMRGHSMMMGVWMKF